MLGFGDSTEMYAVCLCTEQAMVTLCDIEPASLDPSLSNSLKRGLSISILHLPTHLSHWLSYYFYVVQRKNTHVLRKCQKCKSGIPLLQPLGGHSPGTLSPLVPTSQHPPSLAHLPLHCLHGVAGAGRSTGARGAAGIHQSETRPVEPGQVTSVFGSGSMAIAECVPRTRGEQGGGGGPGEDGTGWGSRRDPSSSAGSAAPCCPPCYSGE